jgi:hypothetical protein
MCLWITPAITYNQMNHQLGQDVCPESITDPSRPCCSGVTEPNFIIDGFNFAYDVDGVEMSGLYINIHRPTSQYWVRFTAFNVIALAIWVVFAIRAIWVITWSFDRNDPSFLRCVGSCQLIWFMIFGLAASLTFMYGGPSFPYEFRGFNNGPVSIKYGSEYIPVADLRIVTTYKCGYGEKDGTDECDRGLSLVAGRNFSGIAAYPRPGPWTVQIVDTKDWGPKGIQRGIRLKDECVEQMNDIIVLTGGNIIIPVAFITFFLIIWIFAPEFVIFPSFPSIWDWFSNCVCNCFHGSIRRIGRGWRVCVGCCGAGCCASDVTGDATSAATSATTSATTSVGTRAVSPVLVVPASAPIPVAEVVAPMVPTAPVYPTAPVADHLAVNIGQNIGQNIEQNIEQPDGSSGKSGSDATDTSANPYIHQIQSIVDSLASGTRNVVVLPPLPRV